MRVYPDKTQDQEFNTLGDQGFSGSLNDRQYGYLGSLGYTGALPDRFHRFKKSFLADLYDSGASFLYLGGFNPSQTKMFEQSDKTGEVTGAGQPVGIVLGSGPLLEAVQPTALSRPALGRWPMSGVRNLLGASALTNAWSSANGLIISHGVATETDASGAHSSFLNISFSWVPVESGITYTWTAVAKAGSATHLQLLGSAAAFPTLYANFDLTSGEVSATGGGVIASIEYAGGGWWKCSISMTAAASGAFSPVFCLINNGESSGRAPIYTGSGRYLEISAMQWESGGTATPVQTVTTPNNITEAGVEDVWFLYTDGNDSLLSTVPAGTYEIAHLSPNGLPQYVSETLPSAGTLNILRADRLVDVVVKQGSFTSDEKRKLEQEWERYVL